MHRLCREVERAYRVVGEVTARVTTLKGAEAGAYYVEALPSYYLDAGEPKGIWRGRGAHQLGLVGEVGDADFLDVLVGVHPGSGGATLGRAFGEKSVRGFDVTASAPKSVSTMFAVGDSRIRDQVLASHDSAVAAMLGWVEDHAHTRFRIGGEVAVVDADGIIAATFRQHTSRALDPQLHTHVVIANRVRSPDGRWLALDARSLKLDQRTLSAIYHATLRAELTSRLGVSWRPVENGIAEMAEVSDVVLAEFSTRTGDIARRVDEKLDRFIDTMDREPTPRERWRLEREAVIDSRPPKSHTRTAADVHAGWRAQVETLGIDAGGVAYDAIGPLRPHGFTAKSQAMIIDAAVAALGEKQSSWRPAELTRELAAAMPPALNVAPTDIVEVLEYLTRKATEKHCVDISRPIPDGARLRSDGRPVTESAIDRALTTPGILAQEERLLAWAERRMAHDPVDSTHAAARSGVVLTGPQAHTAAAVAGDAHLVLVVGPAGTGKTTALAPAVAQLQADGRPVFGVAPSAAAADVLGTETGVAADTIDKLLYEHSGVRPPDHRYDLPARATVIVDEAAMVPTNTLDRLAALADKRGWRVALVGDPLQFSPVGRGAMFEHLIDTHGAIELDAVHRFSNGWERQASLRLRRGDPAVADVYDLEGRLHGGTTTRMQAEAVEAWAKARRVGETVVLSAPTTNTVQQLNRAAQQARMQAGEIDTSGRHVDAGGYQMFVGDEIVTRRNHRYLHTAQGLMIRNRDQWTIDAIAPNGDMTASGRNGTVALPSDYVEQYVELGYAQTSHASQGRTVDRSILLLDGPTDVRGVYVPMTRGRHHNDAYIVTDGEQSAVDVFAAAVTQSWIDQPALARQAELAGHNPHRPGTLPAVELQELFVRREELTGTLKQLDEALESLPGQRERERRELGATEAHLAETTGELQDAFDTLAQYDRPLRRRGHQVDIQRAHQTVEHLPPKITVLAAGADRTTARVQDMARRLTRAEALDKTRPAIDTELADIGDRLNDDRKLRSRTIRRDGHGLVIGTLGDRPTDGKPARAWDIAAGQLDQHQTTYGLSKGVGPEQARNPPAGYEHSRGLALGAIARIAQTLTQQQEQARTIEGPYIGIGR